MIVVRGLSPNAAYLRLLTLATQNDWPVEQSRIGPCRDLGAVTVELDGGERSILLAGRGWNPAFALVEAAWVITGRNDVKTLAEFIGNFGRYSDDGHTLQGAYGHRLRHFFGRDQIEAAIGELITHPSSRRVVLTLYAPSDLGLDSKDIPCNTQVTLRRVEGRLEMSIFNRSNDLWLGVPYNWFVFHVLQHMIAGRLGIPCGVQRHVSSCLHLYDAHVAAASRVVACNHEAELDREGMELASLDVGGLLSNATALADLSFDLLTSPQLVDFFDRFRSYRSTKSDDSAQSEARDVLTKSLDRWNTERNSTRLNAMTETLTYNPETEVGLKIQRWVFGTPVDAVVERLSAVAKKALPMLREALHAELGAGLRVEFADAASEQRASLHFVLEIILGTLDPELVRTIMGERLRERLEIVATAAGLEPAKFRVREARDDQLFDLFGALLT
ncbi:MAG: thymidylate synthase [Hydrogenophaga sp.]|uniref:thymidylate synthase n=1 Tax=Hydrogenophaga sp. TaxID=1904254 RepID=UPI002717066F|nr:thymidylate synthase [Hydrogenophaga sp.]MDO9031993.1 thymidylate synthase [Hydrogenophaga sp.]